MEREFLEESFEIGVFIIISLGNSETSSKNLSRELWLNGKHPVYSTISSSSKMYIDHNKLKLKLTKGKDGEDGISCSDISHSVNSVPNYN